MKISCYQESWVTRYTNRNNEFSLFMCALYLFYYCIILSCARWNIKNNFSYKITKLLLFCRMFFFFFIYGKSVYYYLYNVIAPCLLAFVWRIGEFIIIFYHTRPRGISIKVYIYQFFQLRPIIQTNYIIAIVSRNIIIIMTLIKYINHKLHATRRDRYYYLFYCRFRRSKTRDITYKSYNTQ